ncbi:hypothetical protein [Mycoplasma todarodis]|uniref:Uncharacterized protein n=1 Tax=Mycoplasma todarodis TaxID=1937191 RepID=A0A4R0XMX2_9MOLU|nr:hypothetical protein [Mycoplasma todarodis]TCG12084.1 hypothetical protein C4B25_00115 [Mycoplasma todarodis]
MKTNDLDIKLRQMEEAFDIVDHHLKRLSNLESNLYSNNDRYNELQKAHNVRFITKYARNKEVVQKVRHFMSNKTNHFDQELFNLLKFKVMFKGDKSKSYAGRASNEEWMIINMKNDQVDHFNDWNFLFKVTAHELGHIWNFQFGKLLEMDYDEFAYEVVVDYLRFQGEVIPLDKERNWKFLKPLVRDKISNYSKKDVMESFAEIFAFSCFSTIVLNKEVAKWSWIHYFLTTEMVRGARHAIDNLNIRIKQHILKMCLTN